MRIGMIAAGCALAVVAIDAYADNALHLDGVNDRVSAPLTAVLGNPSASDFTIETWLLQPVAASTFGRVLFAQNTGNNVVSVAHNAAGVIYFYVVANGVTYSAATTTPFPSGRWTHLAARWQATTQQVSIFFDGVQMATTAGGGTSTSSNATMTIGARNDGAQPLVAGMLDELRIWSVARSVCVLRRDAGVLLLPTTPGLVTYYDFNQGVAGVDNAGVTALPDLSGADENGTLANFALTGTTSNWVNSNLLTTPNASAVNISRDNLVTSEFGRTDSFDVVLGNAPTQNVVLNLATDNAVEASVLPITLTFTPSDWNVPQPVVVSGLNDNVADGDTPYHVVVTTDPTSDPDYTCEPPIMIDAINLIENVFSNSFE